MLVAAMTVSPLAGFFINKLCAHYGLCLTVLPVGCIMGILFHQYFCTDMPTLTLILTLTLSLLNRTYCHSKVTKTHVCWMKCATWLFV